MIHRNNSLKFLILLMFFLGMSSSRCLANLGEFEAAILVRFGKPKEKVDPDPPATFAQKYAAKGFQIIVGFRDGKSWYEMYEKDNKKPFTKKEIERILDENGKSWKWIEQGNVTQNELWTTEDKSSLAVYSSTTKVLSLKRVDLDAD